MSMGVVFLLGPSEWDADKGGAGQETPMQVRLWLATRLRAHGLTVLVMEQESDEPGEDMTRKFERLLARATDVILYWPAAAKMGTTYTEMVLLRKAADAMSLPRIWFLHHEDVAEIRRGVFHVKERGGRSRYLNDLARLGITPVPWRTGAELRERADLLAAELS